MSALKLHNAMWPGLVGKGDEEGQEPPISLERMLDLTAAAEVDGQKYDGIDYFLFLPHTNPEARDDELKGIADLIQGKGFDIGSLVAPVWPGTVGDSAMGTEEQRGKFLEAAKMAGLPSPSCQTRICLPSASPEADLAIAPFYRVLEPFKGFWF